MRSIRRHRPRRGVALVLIFGLLGMGWLDVEVCRGEDGHVGLDTRIGSCCDISPQLTIGVDCCGFDGPTPERAAAVPPTLDGTPATVTASCVAPVSSAVSGSECVDLPWIHGATTVNAPGAPSPAVCAVVFFDEFEAVRPVRLALSAFVRPDPTLSHLRTTSLLI